MRNIKGFLFLTLLCQKMKKGINYIMVLLAVSCSGNGKDEVLSTFPDAVELEAETVLGLERYDIFSAQDFLKDNDGIYVFSPTQKTSLSYIDLSTGEKQDCVFFGRGPGELIKPTSLQFVDGRPSIYDINKQVFASYERPANNAGAYMPDTLASFHNPTPTEEYFYRLFIMEHTRYGMVTSGFLNGDWWYGLLNEDGSLAQGVEFEQFQALENASALHKSNLHLSSVMSHDDRRGLFACAMINAAVISFSKIGEEGIEEICRHKYYEPVLQAQASPGSPMLSYSGQSRRAFMDVEFYDGELYVLYSGLPLTGQVPSESCSTLLVYDSEGKPKRCYSLSDPVVAIHFREGLLYGLCTWPESKIVSYKVFSRK